MSREKQIEEMAMTPLDILANDIYQHCPDLAENYCGDTHCVACLANALYNAGYRKQSEWISVDERLPEEENPIIVTDGKKVIVAYKNWLYRSNSTGKLRCPANYGNGMYVTHWMPLPEAPKMKGGAE